MLPNYWVDFTILLKDSTFQFAVIVILLGIIAKRVIWPPVSKAHGAFKRLIRQSDVHHKSVQHPHRKDDEGKSLPVHRYELLEEDVKIHEKIDILTEIINKRCGTMSCPAVVKVIEYLKEATEQEEKFLEELLKMRKETKERIDDGYDRINEFMDTLLADKNTQIAEMNELFARMVVALEKRS